MTARFAGSRTLDERRRRWLATNEADRAPAVAFERSLPTQDEEKIPEQADLRHFPLRKVISPKAWKIALVALGIGVLGALLLVAEIQSPGHARHLGPGWQKLMDSPGSRLTRLFQAALLMMSSQLALLIWWGRSQSLRDFEGQYRIWLWAAFCLMFAGWGLVGNWHGAWSETLCWHWSARFPQRDIVFWMFPAVLVGGILWRKLIADMRDSKCSSVLFWTVAITGFAACVFRLGIDRTDWPEATKSLVGAVLQMLASVGLFASFLTHARHVIHISPEPPELRPSVWARLLQGIAFLVQKLPALRLKFSLPRKKTTKAAGEKDTKKPKRSKKTAAETFPQVPKVEATASPKVTAPKAPQAAVLKPKTPASAPEPAPLVVPAKAQEKSVSQSNPPAMSQAVKPTQPMKPATPPPKGNPPKTQSEPKSVLPENKPASGSPSAPPTPPDPKPTATPVSKAPAKPAAEEPKLRVDDPLDPDQLKGLSKKERRNLRKQHKENQRGGG